MVTYAEFTKDGTLNIYDKDSKERYLNQPDIKLSFEVSYNTSSEPNQCIDNAINAAPYVQEQRQKGVVVCVGFMVIHEYWRIEVIEHVWLECEDGEIIDPSLPFLCVTRMPTYFCGIRFIEHEETYVPTLRDTTYKACYKKAVEFANTCEYAHMDMVERKVKIGRVHFTGKSEVTK